MKNGEKETVTATATATKPAALELQLVEGHWEKNGYSGLEQRR